MLNVENQVDTSIVRECREIKHNAGSMISQNKKKIIKIFSSGDYLSLDGFSKLLLYFDNIRKYGKIYMEFKKIDIAYKFENLEK